MSRKDSKGLFANVLGQLENSAEKGGMQRSTSPHLLKVAAGVRQMQERSELAERLLKDGGQIVEIDPDEIMESAIRDRFDSGYSEAGIADLLESMREHGQSTPGLVRPVRGPQGRFRSYLAGAGLPLPNSSASSSRQSPGNLATKMLSFSKGKRTATARTCPSSSDAFLRNRRRLPAIAAT